MISEKSQALIIWWALAFLAIFAIVWVFLLRMIPPPGPSLSEAEVAAFYIENNFAIKLGAVIASWTSGFMIPFQTIIAVQLARLEKQLHSGLPVWSILSFAGGIMMSMFLVFPPICWGVAAFTAERSADVTTLMHELSLLTLTTTDQYFIFQMIPIVVVCFKSQHDKLSAFPRWAGYVTLWIALAFEVGALAFMFKSGPFAWNGLFVFWMPLTLFFVWIMVLSYTMLSALKHQHLAVK
jgi:hypothetical protein